MDSAQIELLDRAQNNPNLHVFLAARMIRARRKFRGTGLLSTTDEDTLFAIVNSFFENMCDSIDMAKYYCTTSNWSYEEEGGKWECGLNQLYDGPVEISVGYRRRKPYIRIYFSLVHYRFEVRMQPFGKYGQPETERVVDIREPEALTKLQGWLVPKSKQMLTYGLLGR